MMSPETNRPLSVSTAVAMFGVIFMTSCAHAPRTTNSSSEDAPIADRGEQPAQPVVAPAPIPPTEPPEPVEPAPPIRNVLRIADNVYAGSSAASDAALDHIQEMGIKVIVSVDAAVPPIEEASARGMRYVQVPLGFNGIPRAQALALTRAIKEAEGPVYVHCLDGSNRAPAAAAMGCIGAGLIDHAAAAAVRKRVETGTAYAGLWRDVAAFQPPPPDTELPELLEVAEVSTFKAAMTMIDRSYRKVTYCADAQWRTPPRHPDLMPDSSAQALWHGFLEASRENPFPDDPRFTRWLLAAKAHAQGVQDAMIPVDPAVASKHLKALQKSCTQCHNAYRN